VIAGGRYLSDVSAGVDFIVVLWTDCWLVPDANKVYPGNRGRLYRLQT
jgi:hypothetical protein